MVHTPPSPRRRMPTALRIPPPASATSKRPTYPPFSLICDPRGENPRIKRFAASPGPQCSNSSRATGRRARGSCSIRTRRRPPPAGAPANGTWLESDGRFGGAFTAVVAQTQMMGRPTFWLGRNPGYPHHFRERGQSKTLRQLLSRGPHPARGWAAPDHATSGVILSRTRPRSINGVAAAGRR